MPADSRLTQINTGDRFAILPWISFASFVAVDVGQADIKNRDVWLKVRQKRQCHLSAFRIFNLVIAKTESLRHYLRGVSIVIDYKYLDAFAEGGEFIRPAS